MKPKLVPTNDSETGLKCDDGVQLHKKYRSQANEPGKQANNERMNRWMGEPVCRMPANVAHWRHSSDESKTNIRKHFINLLFFLGKQRTGMQNMILS